MITSLRRLHRRIWVLWVIVAAVVVVLILAVQP